MKINQIKVYLLNDLQIIINYIISFKNFNFNLIINYYYIKYIENYMQLKFFLNEIIKVMKNFIQVINKKKIMMIRNKELMSMKLKEYWNYGEVKNMKMKMKMKRKMKDYICWKI